MANHIDLNCDMGEFESLDEAELDLAIMPLISRCNIAMAGHAGNEETIRYCFAKAAEHNLHIGIHPGYADRAQFGRRILDQDWSQTAASLCEQIELGLDIAEQLGISISHVKFHGALYNQIEADLEIANSVSELLDDYPQLAVLAMANGQLQKLTEEKDSRFIREAFIDRRYLSLNQLQPRSEAGAVFSSLDDVLEQAIAIATSRPVTAANGESLAIAADSLCIHSDTPDSLYFLTTLCERFKTQNILVS